jgi:hypothetical protein
MIKAKVRTIVQYCSNKKDAMDMDSAVPRFQQAVVEDYLQNARPRVDSWDFD